jgi:hypothetical protein
VIKIKKEMASKKHRKERYCQSERVAPNIQEATASKTIQVSSAKVQDQVTFFIINFTNLI